VVDGEVGCGKRGAEDRISEVTGDPEGRWLLDRGLLDRGLLGRGLLGRGLLGRGLLGRGSPGRGSPGRRLVAIVSAWPVTSCGNIQGEN
jgi:hypothetical protein